MCLCGYCLVSLCDTKYHCLSKTVRPDLYVLNVLLLEPAGSRFFHFQKKKKFDHVIE